MDSLKKGFKDLSSDSLRRSLPIFDVAVRNIIIFISVLSIPLTAAQDLGLSEAQTGSWIAVLYGLPGLVSLVAAIRYQQPLLFTGNIFVIIFIVSLGGTLTYPELIGAVVLAGGVIFLLSIFGLTHKLSAWIPAPVVYGLLAGAVVPFVVRIFTSLESSPVSVGSLFLVYLLSRRLFGRNFPAILPALLTGLLVAALGGQFGPVPGGSVLPIPVLTLPEFSRGAVVTATPVIIVLITLQSNLPSIVYLRSQDYRPPERVINLVSGIGTALGSLFGPTGLSLSLPVTSLVAGPEAGDREIRHRTVYLIGVAALLTGLLAGFAAGLPRWIPLPLLRALAGLALLSVLMNALQEITRGPLRMGPVFAFVIALSNISFLGFDSFFWALAVGIGITYLLEGDGRNDHEGEEEQG
jgi:benzoate membrane transport protein